MSKKIAVIMDSDSDLDTTCPCVQRLKSLGISIEVHIISAHRTPVTVERFASQTRKNGSGTIIAAAGKAAHLAGVLIVYTTLPVIGVLIKISIMGGPDAPLSMVQMSEGVPIVYVMVDGVDNAVILSAQMPALSDEALSGRLVQFKAGMAVEVEAKDYKIQMEEF